ncbi:MAG: glycosyltransferase family 39 protein, partial [Planctomycetales bacterium]
MLHVAGRRGIFLAPSLRGIVPWKHPHFSSVFGGRMEHHKRDQATLALIAALVFFFNLGGVGLWDEDEPKNAACGLEMLARGDWVTPSFNHELRTDKPILLYWLMLTSYQIFGVNEFAARFFSAVCGVGTVLLTYRLGRLLFTPRVGWWAGVILCTAMMFTVLARAVTPDSTLIFFTTLSLYVFVHGATLTENRRTANASEDGETKTAWTNWTPDRWWIWAAMYAIMGFAVLAKGPVGFLLPTTVLGVYLLARGWMESPSIISESSGRFAKIAGFFAWFLGPRRVAGVAWTLRPLTAILAVGLIALPWYVLVGMQTDGAWLAGFLGKHIVGRFLQPMDNHRGPIFFYMLATMV